MAAPTTQPAWASASHRVSVDVARRPGDIDAARRLHAEVYLAKGYVTQAEVVDGLIVPDVDPWVADSTYFLARDDLGEPVGVSRQITPPRVEQLPTMGMRELHPAVDAQLRRQPPHSVVEISALAVRRWADRLAATLLYSCMWERSRRLGHRAWVMSVHPVVWEQLNRSLGPVLEAFGPTQWYLGSDVIPSFVWMDRTAAIIAAHAATLPPGPRRELLPSLFPPSTAKRAP